MLLSEEHEGLKVVIQRPLSSNFLVVGRLEIYDLVRNAACVLRQL